MEQTNHIKILLKIKDDHIKITDIIDINPLQLTKSHFFH